jgi:hypothetical protein
MSPRLMKSFKIKLFLNYSMNTQRRSSAWRMFCTFGNGATLEISQNGKSCGKAFRRIAGKLFPTMSVIEDCQISIQTVDPFESQ